MNKGKGRDITGIRNGKLVAIKKVPKPNPEMAGRDAWWLCKCDCGNEITVRLNAFINRGQESCWNCAQFRKRKNKGDYL